MLPTRTQILRLYKDLLRYGDMLTLTDKNYYKKRIKEEFNNNRDTSSEAIKFLYEGKQTIDKSKVPELHERDLEEHFIKGGGPGGQKVNKGNNCVYLIHKPTGFSVKVHETRDQGQNRKIARRKLITMLDNHINRENSIENQKKKILEEKSKNRSYKQKKLAELKTRWKEIVSDS